MLEQQTSPRDWSSMLRVSKSQIQTYLICPRKFYFQYVMGAPPEFLPASLPFGSALHAAVASFYLALKETGTKPELAFVIREFETEWEKATAGTARIVQGQKRPSTLTWNSVRCSCRDSTKMFSREGLKPSNIRLP